MITDCGVEIDAPAAVVWDVFSDVERWPEWTASVTRLVALDGPGLAVGKRFEIKQPRMPKLVWEVTEVTPGASWTWVQRSPGGLTVARHEVIRGIRPAHPGSAAARPARAGWRLGGVAHARDDEALPRVGGGGPQGPKRAAARRWPVRLTSNGARSCSTRW